MKKILAFLVMVSFMSAIVIAVDQNVDVTIGDTAGIVVTPTPTLSFGSVLQGTNNNAATNGPITLAPVTGANTDMTIAVSVSGAPFATGLKFGETLASGQIFNLGCTLLGDVCSYTNIVITPTLDIPMGFAASSPTGVITYTVTGVPPVQTP